MFLTHFARKVTVVHRRGEFRAEKILQARLFANQKIAVVWDSAVEEVLGKAGPPASVTGVRIKNLKTGAVSELKADGVFVAIGHAPSVALVGDQLRMKPNGYLWTAPDSTATSLPGIFAAGDVTDDTFRQAVTAAGQGCMAALEAEKFLAHYAETAVAAE
jgi:thioredoxin reductase (NADPH)